jgi:invasion protein IalB
MTRSPLWRAALACMVLLMAAAGGAVSAQEMLSPKPMIDHPPTPIPPPAPGPAQNAGGAKRAAPPSQAVAGMRTLKPAVAEDIGDWLLRCYMKPNRICQISQRQVNPKNKALVIWLELTHYETPKAAWQIVVMLPLGFRVAPNLPVRADGELFATLPILTCVVDGCVYSAELPVAGLGTLQKAQKLATEIVDLNGRRYAINVSMRGFGQAYGKNERILKEK